MGKHLYITDLDGTLLNSRGIISAATREMMIRLLRSDTAITVATARHITSIQPLLEGIPLSLPVITGGGAYISSVEHGTHEYVNAMSREIAWSVYNRIHSYGMKPFISSFNGRDNLSYFHQPTNTGMEWYLSHRKDLKDTRLRLIDDPADALEEQVVTIFVIDRLPVLETLHAELAAAHAGLLSMHILENLYSRDWFWLIVHDRQSRKNRGAAMVMKKLGYAKKDVTVFGDEINDIDLFEVAGRRVAVANAVDKLKELADVIIGSNDEDSVPRFILDDIGQR